jgi:alcohol dehydrogenase (cytochrome c)
MLQVRTSTRLRAALLAAVFMTPAVGAMQSGNGEAPAARDWTTVGGDWANSRYSTLAQINLQTVNRLGAAWVSKRFEDGASSRSTPVVKDGVMFMTAGARVYALNAQIGDVVWTWRAELPPTQAASVASTGALVQALNAGIGFPNPSGVAVGDGLAFVGLMDGQVAALDQKTGVLKWRRQIGDDPPKKGQSVSAAPVYARGVLFAGLANGDWALRGRVVALDAKSGTPLWTFFVVPGPGEPGHDTWAQDNDVWKMGGGGVWMTGAIDEDLGLVYFVTGNAVPQEGGQLRPGDNLYTASIVALEVKTGKLAWHYQVVHHDLWDADIAVPLLLYDAQVSGRARKAVAAMRSDGYLFLLDRQTGKPLLPVEERPVPQDAALKSARTQPFPVGADMLVPDCYAYRDRVPEGFELGCQFTPPSTTRPNVLATGHSVRVTPMAYSPQTGYIYAQGSSGLGLRRRITDDPWFWAGGGGGVALLGLPSTGVFAAIDSRTNKIVWKKEIPTAVLGNSGPLTTAGGLVFRGAADGNVEAYDARTGDRVWQFQTGTPGGRGPAATYEVGGEQHVALTFGPEVWAFKLGGSVSPRPAAAPTGTGAGLAAPSKTSRTSRRPHSCRPTCLPRAADTRWTSTRSGRFARASRRASA